MNVLRSDLAYGAGLIGVDQSVGRGDGDRLLHGWQVELDGVFGWKLGMNFDGCR